MRDALSRFLVEAAVADNRFLVLSGDHGYALFDALRTDHGSQFINVGVAEQNMIGVAAGLAKLGFRPCVYGLAAFVPIRVLEQIKLDLCHAKLPVILLGDGAGLVYSTLGVSHQCGEDVACLRPMPALAIYSPCDAFELAACWAEARRADHPSYIRIGKADRPPVHTASIESTDPQWTARAPQDSRERLLVATGSMTSIATRIARAHGLPCLSVPRIKPLPSSLVDVVRAHRATAVIEEHAREGGLFGALAEHLASAPQAPADARLSHFGLDSRFTTTAGTYEHALAEHGIDDATLSSRLAAWMAAGSAPVM
jgi:transketolase